MLTTLLAAYAAEPMPGTTSTPTWCDEFDTPGAPNPKNWGYEVGLVRNKEAQFYTRARPENAVVVDGNLVITARHEAWSEGDKKAAYTSASLMTQDKQEFGYGRFEVRAKLPTGRGIWPAIWFLGADKKLTWPACGEIDLMEYVGFDPEKLHFNIHTTAYNHVKKTNKGIAVTVPAATDWHVYGLELHHDKLTMSLDGKLVFTYSNEGTGPDVWPFDKPMYMILNVAVGGAWGGQKGIDDTVFPQAMLIDYVRYWKADK
ncbi:MAG: glycoside hydrolase family 16 protein [Planctomycetota bacterium]